jgi:hypothetical protein
MSFESSINTGLPETPVGIPDPQAYEQFLLVYNAIRALQTAIEEGGGGGGTGVGPQGPQGYQGAQGSGTSGEGASVPYYIASTETFTVPENKQALFSVPIIVDGYIVVDGYLVEVD